METLFDGSVDGALLTTSGLSSTVPLELTRRGIPFVQVGRQVEGIESGTVVVDNSNGAKAAAALILELGHRRIGAVLGPSSTSTGLERGRSFQDRLAAEDLAPRPEHVVSGKFDDATGHAALPKMMGSENPPSAVFCASDVLALGVLNAAHSSGLRIPEDLSVIGFDDIPMASCDLFNLTTISADLKALAAAACEMLLRRLEDPEAVHDRIVIDARLVLRGTHAQA